MQSTSNTPNFIEAQQYSAFILENLKDGLLPQVFFRNVSDFGSGTVLNIKTIGAATLQDVTEDTPLIYNPIETGNVQLQINNYVGDAWYTTDVLRQDGEQIDILNAQRAVEATRALQEDFETKLFSTLNAAQTPADLNNINGFAHRFVASGTNQDIELTDLIQMKLAFDKANVPQAGRMAVVDPVVAASLLQKFQGTYNVDSNPRFQAILESGFDREHQFVMNVFGWDIVTSNYLPDIADETIDSVQVLNGKANIFMSVLDDQTRPGMFAERQAPRVESERNKDRQRDEFLTTWRYGLGVQRVDTLGVILASATALS